MWSFILTFYLVFSISWFKSRIDRLLAAHRFSVQHASGDSRTLLDVIYTIPEGIARFRTIFARFRAIFARFCTVKYVYESLHACHACVWFVCMLLASLYIMLASLYINACEHVHHCLRACTSLLHRDAITCAIIEYLSNWTTSLLYKRSI